MPTDLRAALNSAVADELDAALSRIAHCVAQLSEEQVWHRPPHGLNAIGNLLLHLEGNVTQAIAHNLSGAPDTRDRPAEFAARGPVPKAELLASLARAVAAAKAALAAAPDERLAAVARVNNNDWTGIQAVVRSAAHLRGHAQEIIHMTRQTLGDAYQFAGPK